MTPKQRKKKSDEPDCHWDPIKERTRGLGENLLYVSRRTYEVSNLKASLRFFRKILRFRIIELDETSATLDCKNMLLTIKVGTPVTFSGENLIVNHLSVDVEDVAKAFDYLHRVDVPFEINVSVSMGGGPSFAEGGGLENTVGQAFTRDPDGYYIEICNCHLLTDFVLGKDIDYNPDLYNEGNVDVDMSAVRNLTVKWAAKLLALSERAKNFLEDPMRVEPLPKDRQPKKVNSKILNNLLARKKVYSSICQSFTDAQLEEILLQAGNYAPYAILIMRQMIDSGEAIRIHQPPAYYVNDIDEDALFKPDVLVEGDEEEGHDEEAPKLSAGQQTIGNLDDYDDEGKTRKFRITSVNHIGIIVDDVGLSVDFYADVLGLQAVNRPKFDVHGAWFTAGNLEFHLILGNPLPPDRSIKGPDANPTYFKVKDLALAKEVLAQTYAANKSIQLEVESNACYIRDPDGYVYGIHE